jgi:hypothetical protein
MVTVDALASQEDKTQTQMLSASTPTAVRGIATDAGDGIIYVTAPDSNSLINIPFPPLP